ncbi:MAG TPA: TonB-dependent receptor [Candidatus Acidoferrum sp.]|nr:TonB-dependent receptor [Candidatus Acidoferrum sp.]
MKTIVLRSVFLLFAVSVLSFSSRAQNNSPDAHLSGRVTDASGYTIAGAKVTAQAETAPAPAVSIFSAVDGTYALSLPPGLYRIRFERPAFVPREISLSLADAGARTLDVKLEIAQLSENIVVTANVQPLEISQTPAPVDIVTLDQFRQRQPVSLADALQFLPGATIARTGREGGLTTFFLDGGNSNFTKFFVDGTPLNEPGGFLNLSNQTLDNIDKLELVHGAESALYGTDAVVGVVQLFSHRGATRIPELNLLAEGGGYSSARGAAQLAGLLGAFDYSLAGSYFQTAGQGSNDAFLNRSFTGNFGYRVNDSNQLRLIVRSNSSVAGIPGPILFRPPNLSQFESLKLLLVHLSWEFRTGSHWVHRLSGYENRTLDTNANPPFFTSIDQFNRAGLQEQSTYTFRTGAVAAGYDYEVENGYPSLITGFHARRNNQAGFLDARWLPIPRLTFSAGARVEANTSFGTRVVPRAGLVYALHNAHGFWGDTRARFSYGQGFKEPALEQSFGSDPCFPGNSTLRPERSQTYDAGIDQFLAGDRLRLSATYFNNRFRDLVSFTFDFAATPACPFGTGTYFNTDLARARGVNLSGELRLRRWLSLDGSYSHDDSRVLESPNAFDPVQLPGNHLLRRPVNSGSLILNTVYRHWNLNLTGYFTGIRTDSDFFGLGFTHNPGYARFDLATSYFLARGISFTARVTNLFDKQYQDALGFPALGRDFRLGLNYRFSGRN